MRVINAFFSPTGGTRAVAEIVANAIGEPYELDLIKKGQKPVLLGEDDVAVISAPAFAGRIPSAQRERLELLKGNGAKAVIVAVSVEWPVTVPSPSTEATAGSEEVQRTSPAMPSQGAASAVSCVVFAISRVRDRTP